MTLEPNSGRARRLWNSILIALVAVLAAAFWLGGSLFSFANQDEGPLATAPHYQLASTLSDPFPSKEFGQSMTAYALISRLDGTVRRALVSSFAVSAAKDGKAVPIGSIFAVEVVDNRGDFGFVDVRQRLGDGWSYGRFEPDQVDFTTRNAPDECDACHRQSNEAGEPFTLHLLQLFAQSGSVQQVSCSLSDRDPCRPLDSKFH